jgi:1-deoxy-D-xylulose-5-phosphate reductoisomerase
VEAFLNRQIRFPQIAALNAQVLEHFASSKVADLEEILSLDSQARVYSLKLLKDWS